ncbi:uncharacterized protein EI90DRAFT_1023174 [Cantharellus anzutake]|uniref:uncharacterized protein n=1 Tax=Cantharellus anzutake TaxID=1750568 RepID=UPI001905F1E4|nr:uncharacterized protein EI90DRAFT_1023174 [Cantharellus anzutake]KAF8331454.1 hypothetical protein EI90DRAFT_1023174 [Cantharellus anzutake]
MSRSSLPPVQNSKGKGRALDEGPGVEALHGISQRMEKHPELYTPMYIFSAGAAVRRRSTSTEEDDSGASYGTSEEEVDELDEEDVQKREYFYRGRGRARSDEGSDIYLSGDASSPPWEVLGGEPGDAEDQDEEEEEAQEEQGVEEEEQGEDQADQEVEGEDEDGEEEGGEGYEGDEDEDEDDGLEARTVESPKAEEAETVPGRGASDPIIIDDDEEPMIERVPAGSPMYVELRHTSQNSGEVEDLSLLHTMVAAQEDHQPFSPAQSTPLFGDFTDSQPMSEHEDHQSQEHNNDLNGEGGFGPKTLQMDGDWPNDLQGAIGIFRHETDSQHVSLPADLIVPSLHRVADEGIPDPLANDATEHPEVPPKPDSNALSPEMSMFVEASGATTDDAIIAATSPRPQLVPLTGAIAAIANASGDRPDSPEGTVAGASKSALVFSPLVDFPTPLFAGDVYASGPVLPLALS